jgi:hypothetical protein
MADTVASKIELFGKWSYDDVEITDISLEDYIAVNKKYCVYLPHTAGRYARKRFRKVCRSPFREQQNTHATGCFNFETICKRKRDAA